MKTETLEIEAAIQIQKPINEVFDAIINPDKMSNYFISESTGKMESGKTLIWKFPEFDVECPIRIDKIQQNKYISYYWTISEKELLVEITLIEKENNSTLVSITEKSMKNDNDGLKWFSGNTFGWSNFLACLKAYLEYNINLRKGAFDFMRKENQCS
ncbi:ATPase [Flavobacterium sp. 316]|uniref:SRPBCC domain-containing protein n=1 Tax=Flavobacterium sediminilitoris TaxID=2024526 RepID=A0ABY4HKM2_9FLAO|nr:MULTISPECIES: SRPBCC domain-containing protein [Flavobacterium]KIX20224.1 ATPase [Flavobacterium sp. 316]UOX33404.1 SRPBCC domain-containing protein [Flavobacterium sediminilitoris]